MNESIDEAENFMERTKRSERRQKLFDIINGILSGKINSSRTPLHKIFNQKGPRKTYISPKDRATYNYGYMEESEMSAGTPFYGES